MERRWIAVIAILVVVIVVGSTVAVIELEKPGAPKLTETGSSLLYPVFNAWQVNYTNASISTVSSGSGTGIASALSGADIIGASDAYMSPSDAKSHPYAMNIPILISYQYLTYNIPGLNGQLKLNATIITGIYNGSITKWNDPMIQGANPGLNLPSNAIVAVHRSDGSGDTFMFTSFLSLGNKWWSSNVGASTNPSWKNGGGADPLAGNGNQGVLADVNSTKYSIGYIAATYTSQINQDKLGTAALENAAGHYVNGTVDTVSQAASQYLTEIPANGTKALQFAPGNNSYPIADLEYVVVLQNQSSNTIATALQDFLKWIVSPNGGSSTTYTNKYDLVALPSNVVDRIVMPLIGNIHGPGGSASSLVTLSESGSSLLYPLFNKWEPDYTNATITTLSTGSGTGIASALAGTVVIGASDAYMSPSDANSHPNAMNIPILISYQYIVYNLPSVTQKLRLNGNIIAGIYNASITNWNDPAIQNANPGVTLPSNAIVAVHRSDGSGDTFMFTSFLSKANTQWNSTVGASTNPSWPNGGGAHTLAGNGNQGVLADVAGTQYSVGYVAATYTSQITSDNLGIAELQNRAGNYVNGTPTTVADAAAQYLNQIPANGTIALQYAPGADSYPIADMEYVIVLKTQQSSAIANALKDFLNWAVSPSGGSASKYLGPLDVVALPSNVITNVTDPLINKITG